jgi:hypothetical protein
MTSHQRTAAKAGARTAEYMNTLDSRFREAPAEQVVKGIRRQTRQHLSIYIPFYIDIVRYLTELIQ